MKMEQKQASFQGWCGELSWHKWWHGSVLGISRIRGQDSWSRKQLLGCLAWQERWLGQLLYGCGLQPDKKFPHSCLAWTGSWARREGMSCMTSGFLHCWWSISRHIPEMLPLLSCQCKQGRHTPLSMFSLCLSCNVWLQYIFFSTETKWSAWWIIGKIQNLNNWLASNKTKTYYNWW